MGLGLAVVLRISANLSHPLMSWLTLVCTHILRYCGQGHCRMGMDHGLVRLVLAQCRTITLRIGWSFRFSSSKSIGIYAVSSRF